MPYKQHLESQLQRIHGEIKPKQEQELKRREVEKTGKYCPNLSKRATLVTGRGTMERCGVHGDILDFSWHEGKRDVPRLIDELAATSD